MKKVGNWVLDHLKLVFSIAVAFITCLVILIVMVSSYTSYKTYEARFNQNDLDIRSLSPAQPTATEIVPNYKSKLKYKYSFGAEDLKVTTSQQEYVTSDGVDLTQSGGKIEAAVEIEEKAFVDIVFTISSEYKVTEDEKDVYGIKDLLSNVGLVVNGEKMDDVVDLPDENWYQLALTGFAIPAGNVEVTLSNVSGKNSMMPKIRDVTFYSSQRLSLPDEEAA